MRILHVLEPTVAGVPRLVRRFAEQQVAVGHTVHVLAPSPLGPVAGTTGTSWSLRRRRPWTYVRAAREVLIACRTFRPDVIHVHSFFAGLVTRLPLTQRLPAPLVYQPHAWAFEVGGGRVRWLVRCWERYAARRTQALVTNCQDELDRGRVAGVNTPGSPVGIAVNVDELRPPSLAERATSRQQRGVDSVQVALVLGRLAPQKGQDQLVRAWAADPVPGARLVLVGRGDPSSLAHVAGPCWGDSIVHVAETTDVRGWLWAADLLLIPSHYETVSLVAGEAMSTGLPVVATAVDGVTELLDGDGADPAGVVVPLADMRAMTASARALLTAPIERERLGASGRWRAVRYCSPQHVERALQTVYASIQRQGEQQ